MNTSYFVDMIESDLDGILKSEKMKDDTFTRILFNQKEDSEASFYKNVIEQSSIQSEYWARVTFFVFRLVRFIKYHCDSTFWMQVYWD